MTTPLCLSGVAPEKRIVWSYATTIRNGTVGQTASSHSHVATSRSLSVRCRNTIYSVTRTTACWTTTCRRRQTLPIISQPHGVARSSEKRYRAPKYYWCRIIVYTPTRVILRLRERHRARVKKGKRVVVSVGYHLRLQPQVVPAKERRPLLCPGL